MASTIESIMRKSERLSQRIAELSFEQRELLAEQADMTLTTRHNLDGSTGLDVFENGVALCLEVVDFRTHNNEPEATAFWGEYDTIAYFFVAVSEDEALEEVEDIVAD